MENRIIEVGGFIDEENKRQDNRAERMALIAEDYVSRDAMRRAQTQIITFGNEDRVLQNAMVREGLILKGELTGPRLITDILVSRRLSEIERSQVGFYHVGDVLRFNVSQSGGIHKGEYWTSRRYHPSRAAPATGAPRLRSGVVEAPTLSKRPAGRGRSL